MAHRPALRIILSIRPYLDLKPRRNWPFMTTSMTMIIITTMPPVGAMIMLDFIWYAALAGIGITLMTGPLGCFIVWRRLSYFGDTLSHGALLGVGLSLFSGLPSQLAVFGVSV